MDEVLKYALDDPSGYALPQRLASNTAFRIELERHFDFFVGTSGMAMTVREHAAVTAAAAVAAVRKVEYVLLLFFYMGWGTVSPPFQLYYLVPSERIGEVLSPEDLQMWAVDTSSKTDIQEIMLRLKIADWIIKGNDSRDYIRQLPTDSVVTRIVTHRSSIG
jgi:hypothetical protein